MARRRRGSTLNAGCHVTSTAAVIVSMPPFEVISRQGWLRAPSPNVAEASVTVRSST
jgi:hypothetical protein